MKKSLKEILAPMSMSEKTSYIWHYYRLHIVGVFLVIITAVVMINSFMNQKETVLNVMIVSEKVDPVHVEKIKETLNEDLIMEKDKGSTEITVQTIPYSPGSLDPQMQVGLQKLAAELTTASIDILIVEKGFFDELNAEEQLLSIQQLSEVEKLPFNDVYQSSTNPDDIVGVALSNIHLFDQAVRDENMILCIPANTKHTQYVSRFLKFIL